MYINYLSESLFEKAQANFINKKYSTALDLLKKALDHVEESQSSIKGHICFLMAETYFAMVQYRDTIKAGKQALEFYLADNLFLEAAQTHELIGDVFYQMGQYHDAVKHYHQALKTMPVNPRSKKEKKIKAQIHLSLGMVAQNLLDIQCQQRHYSRGLFISQKIADPYLTARAFLGLGNCFFQKQKYAEGRRVILKACKYFNQLGDIQGVALALNSLGQIYTKDSELHRAINALKLAYYLFEYLDDQIYQASSLVHLARIYLQLDMEKSLKLCGQVAELLANQKAVHYQRQAEIILGQSYVVLGLYYKHFNLSDLARNYFQESMVIFKNYYCKHEYREVRYLLDKITTLNPEQRLKKNNILAFKLGIPF